ncbi:CoA transferase [Herbaspirillum sp. DW155]|uniref:CoA transferase n=1 Tax=Herbaspirillum sp. DW155 TaxID=3095609 RepID=UPI00309126DD|nr:CoA transferase [Herbaspirillum sp. DW155]
MTSRSIAQTMLQLIWSALDGHPDEPAAVRLVGQGDLPSVFATTDLAQASVAAAGLALAGLVHSGGAARPEVVCDRRLAAMWFSSSLRPQGWAPPPLWDAVAGDYRAADGWIRLHTNAPHHRAAALAALGLDAQSAAREDVAHAVARWQATELESAVVAHGGCAAQMRSHAQWASHPQGAAVASEPLVARQFFAGAAVPARRIDPARPLAGVRVLDLTRVLAGPTATRFLAGFGADVLRIDPAYWDEPGVVPEMTLGKRCAGLDLRRPADRAVLEDLLRQADVMVHGYRADALERLGLGAQRRRELNPGLVDVALNAYGWSGPWAARRGFDSLVQMSSGIAEAGMRAAGGDKPVPLPVQALDHATGYLMAAAAVRGLTLRQTDGAGSQYRLSLARTACLLAAHPAHAASSGQPQLAGETPADLHPHQEMTAWGTARRLLGPLSLGQAEMAWDRPASPLRSARPAWS